MTYEDKQEPRDRKAVIMPVKYDRENRGEDVTIIEQTGDSMTMPFAQISSSNTNIARWSNILIPMLMRLFPPEVLNDNRCYLTPGRNLV